MSFPFSPYDFFGYLITGFLVLASYERAFEGDWLLNRDWKIGSAAFFLGFAYIIGHIIAHFASFWIEHVLLRKRIGNSEELLFRENQPCWRKTLFPVYHEPLPAKVCERILGKASAEGYDRPGRALFYHCHSIVKKDKTTIDRLNSFLNMYGFCRNVCMGLFISALILFVGSTETITFTTWRFWTEMDIVKARWAFAAFFGAFAMFYRYLKFYRHYTMEVFLTYSEWKDSKDK